MFLVLRMRYFSSELLPSLPLSLRFVIYTFPSSVIHFCVSAIKKLENDPKYQV